MIGTCLSGVVIHHVQAIFSYAYGDDPTGAHYIWENDYEYQNQHVACADSTNYAAIGGVVKLGYVFEGLNE